METKHWLLVAAIALILGVMMTVVLYEPEVVREEVEVPVEVEKIVEVEKVVEVEVPVETEETETLRSENEQLQQEIDSLLAEQEETSSEEPVVDSETIDNLFLGDMVSFTIDDGDLLKLFDGEIIFDEDEYDTHEEMSILPASAYIMYSGLDDEELEERPALGFFEDGALEYRYVFDDKITMSDVTEDEPLSIRFLGEDLEIIAIDADEMELRKGDKYILREGEHIMYEDMEILLAFVSENEKISVCVDGVCEVIEEHDTETIEGLDIRADEILVNNREGIATIYIGPDTVLTQESSDEWLDDDDSEWHFEIVASAGELEALLVYYDEQHDKVDSEYPPLYLGDVFSFPREWLRLTFSELLNAEYTTYTFEFDEFHQELYDDTDIDNDECMRIDADTSDGIEVLTEETDEVFICENGKAYYQDSTDDWFESDVTDVELVNDDARVPLAIGGAGRVRLENPDDILIRLDTFWTSQTLGLEEDEAESGDILYGSETVGEREETLMTPYGALIVSPESNADNDEFTYKLPSDKLEIELSIS